MQRPENLEEDLNGGLFCAPIRRSVYGRLVAERDGGRPWGVRPRGKNGRSGRDEFSWREGGRAKACRFREWMGRASAGAFSVHRKGGGGDFGRFISSDVAESMRLSGALGRRGFRERMGICPGVTSTYLG